ncbi:hypothetical protein BC629DRAFT_918678 [Irpex lacteus]|nr:hypothetical protein BC629DRAFT_918678 [Irpex lacteus]
MFTDFYPFEACTPEDSATREKNRKLYALLATDDHCYIYSDPTNIELPASVYRNNIIQAILNKAWFRDGKDLGVAYRHVFAPDNGHIQNEVIALIGAGIRHAIDEWEHGVRTVGRASKGKEFSAKHYSGVYTTHLNTLKRWEKHSNGSTFEGTSLWLRKKMFRDALLHAGVSVTVEHSEPLMAIANCDRIFALNGTVPPGDVAA